MDLYTLLYTAFQNADQHEQQRMTDKSIEIIPQKQVVLYKQGNTRNYQVRIKTEQGYFKKSTGESDFEKAKIKAIEYHTLLKNDALDISTSPTITNVCKKFIQTEANKADTSIINNYILPRLGKVRIDKLKYDDIHKYFREGFIKTESTFVNHRTIFNKLFDFSSRQGYIKDYRHLKINISLFKDMFENKEIDHIGPQLHEKIRKHFPEFIEQSRNYKTKAIRLYLQEYLEFILKTGIRPGKEITGLKFKDVDIETYKAKERREEYVGYVKIRHGKVSEKHQRTIPINQAAIENIAACLLYTKEESEDRDLSYYCSTQNYVENMTRLLHKIDKSDINIFDYVSNAPADLRVSGETDFNELKKQYKEEPIFTTYTKTAEYNKAFSQLIDFLESKGVIEPGQNLVPYSYRHAYITNELKKKRDIYSLAAYCGTSVKMIEDHYSDYKSIVESEDIFQEGSRYI